ncbi:MAG TPA: GTP-binding protein [Eoetvoesiella sp.]
MSSKIPVSVVTGFLGSGKTTLLNRALSHVASLPQAGSIVVIVNEVGQVGLDHQLVKHISDNVVLLESGCVCCSVHGELVGALRDLFMAALQKKIPAFSRVIIETTGLADPSPIMYTLKYERFLSERYAYEGCISVVDAVHGRAQLGQHPEAMQQAVLADAIVITKAELVSADEQAALEDMLSAINASAPRYFMGALPALPVLLEASSFHNSTMINKSRLARRSSMKFSENVADGVSKAHADVRVITLSWAAPVARSVFIKAISQLQAQAGPHLLRVKGIVFFQGESTASVIHGVHGQLYPVEAFNKTSPEMDGGAEGGSVLVFVLRGFSSHDFERNARALLFGAAV